MILTTEEYQRYHRQINLQEIGYNGQKQLKSASVLCVGVGGLGSPLSLYLAASGVGRLGLVDGDTIDLSNLHRQVLYCTSDCGQAKVDKAKEQLVAMNPNCNIDTYAENLTSENVLDIINQYDIIADCSDNFATRYLVSDACFKLNKINVSASVRQFEGQLIVFPGNAGPCYRCLHESVDMDKIPNCASAGVLGAVAGIMGTLQANEVLKCILQIGKPLLGQLLVFDALAMTSKILTLPVNSVCAHHGLKIKCTIPTEHV